MRRGAPNLCGWFSAFMDSVTQTTPSARIASARRRARVAKMGMLWLAGVVFVTGMVAARSTAAGHTRRPIRPLAPPRLFVRIVRESALQAGVIAPTQAPPSATTAQS
jgi:hypothetical protein